ncbi:hypothetical protein [Rhizorhapis sp. SPR117]|uniref:hypothetical protein n=1 Tax=Rhizorhapis sp. SPR117 TaxID=2912611 RepID=UPI001F1F77B5|nr:hypothetical protein [Rhizorhapis sp. SPR117]
MVRSPNTRKRFAGLLFIVAAFVINEVFGWGIDRILDYIADHLSWAQIAHWQWGGWISVALVVIGVVLLFWPSPKGPTTVRTLHIAADHALASIPTPAMHPWATGKINYTQSNIVGESALVTFRKAWFKIPRLSDDADQKASQLSTYFQALVPYLKDGHLKEARATAKKIVSQIEPKH